MKHLSGMTRVVLGAALVIAFISPATATEDTQSLARELWEKALAAKGGRERLRQITNVYVAADQGQGYRQLTFYRFPDFRFDFSYDPVRENTSIEVSNGKRGIVWWLVLREAQPRNFQAEDVYRILLPQFLYLMVTHEIEPVPLRVRKEWVGLKRLNVVETDAQGWRVDYYLDSKTYLPVRVDLPNGVRAQAAGEISHFVSLGDYSAVDGVMMPHTTAHSFKFNPERWKERLKFEINTDYNPEAFEKPPTLKTSAEGWRPNQRHE